MTVQYYLAPWIAAYSIGDGRFALFNPGAGRPVSVSRCLIYGQWNLKPNSSLTIKGVTGTGFGKAICLTRVDQDDSAIHALIAADAAIRRLPFSDAQLDSEFQSLSASQQQAITNGLEALRMDSTWVLLATPVRAIMRYILCVLFGAAELGVDFPEADLINRWNTLTTGQRNRIVTYLNGWNVVTNDINNNTPLRTVITKIGRIARGDILLGPDTF